MHQLKNSFADGANTKKDGMIDIYLKKATAFID